ncbi:MAG TPA: 2-hydroxychromene-2-carboxylate isomerase [Aliidongia sp.]|uniref:2-hydroxychromene-2-carboxylate isomerase n=1 Tax=Aliidongia sp. TaxID=1914230 RepID=UPI002DDDA2BE|nr:2-hydroxychromene-2-carboxylate isomerase [Aliidongia sp.]HEV2673882.1 2-hydroxychromene-2-carboxylate isomerase [Aliidongia sp.]
MPATIDFYFDFISPYSYLASVVLPRVAAERSAVIRYRPVGLLDLMQIVGNRPTTIECRSKGSYAMVDLQRWAKRYQVDFAPSPFWQGIDFAELGRGLLVAEDEGRAARYVDAVYPAVYGRPIDLSQRAELVAVLDRAGFDGAELLRRAGAADYVARLAQGTAEAAERGVFGSPTMIVDGEMFFGNDRLDFLSEALRSAA